MTLADSKNIREAMLDNLRHETGGVSKTKLAACTERDTGAGMDAILSVYRSLRREGVIYDYQTTDGQVTVKLSRRD